MDIMVILLALGSALAYSLFFYAKDWVATGAAVDYHKLGATLIVGASIGVIFAYFGNPLGQDELWKQLGIYSSITALIDQLLLKMLPKAVANYRKTATFKGSN